MTKSFAVLYCHHAITLPRVVTGPGRYCTRSGETVEVVRLEGHNGSFAVGAYSNGVPESWYPSGRVLPHYLSSNDIVRAL